MDRTLRADADKITAATINAVLPDEAVKRALEGRELPGRVLLPVARRPGRCPKQPLIIWVTGLETVWLSRCSTSDFFTVPFFY